MLARKPRRCLVHCSVNLHLRIPASPPNSEIRHVSKTETMLEANMRLGGKRWHLQP